MDPRTTLARWLRDSGITAIAFAERLAEMAPRLGLVASAAPKPKALLDSINARHWPHPITVFLVRHGTNGDVDLEHWVRDLKHLWPTESRGSHRRSD